MSTCDFHILCGGQANLIILFSWRKGKSQLKLTVSNLQLWLLFNSFSLFSAPVFSFFRIFPKWSTFLPSVSWSNYLSHVLCSWHKISDVGCLKLLVHPVNKRYWFGSWNTHTLKGIYPATLRTASHDNIIRSEESALCLIPHALAYRCPQWTSAMLIDREEREISSLPFLRTWPIPLSN